MKRSLPDDHVPRAICEQCMRPVRVCYCGHVQRLETRTRVLILQHPRERKVGINTARIASLCLPNSVFVRGIDFSHDRTVQGVLRDPSRTPALLFPGPGAIEVDNEPTPLPMTLVVLDGTWWQAAKLYKSNAFLRELPRFGLPPGHISRYRIRREPADNCVSTIEALAAVLGAWEGDPERMARLLIPFDAMIERQLEISRQEHCARHGPSHRRPAARMQG
jgi:DTW domain-containing protein